MRLRKSNKGFTLIEILLVVVIIGIMLAVIVPRAWRANIDAKYGLVRQAATELVSFSHEWAEQQIQAQPEYAQATPTYYFASLSANNYSAWVGSSGASNWNDNAGFQTVAHRGGAGVAANPETSVEGVVPPEKQPVNPFNGASYFRLANDPSPAGQDGVVAGAIMGSFAYTGGNERYYALIFLGTDSEPGGFSNSSYVFHAGMSAANEPGLRNGIFWARTTGETVTP